MTTAHKIDHSFDFDAQLGMAVAYLPLKVGPKCLLHFLAQTFNKHVADNIWPSNQLMAELNGVSVRTILNWKDELVKGGWIHIVECVQKKQARHYSQQTNYHYLSPSIMINYRLKRKEREQSLRPNTMREKEITELKTKLSKAQEETRSKNIRPSQTASLTRIGKIETKINSEKPVYLAFGQQRSNYKNFHGGEAGFTLTTKENINISKDTSISTTQRTSIEPKPSEEKLQKIAKIFETATGIKSSSKKLEELEQKRIENDLSVEQLEKNIEKISSSPILKNTTNSIVRASYPYSVLAFGERKAQVELERSQKFGNLNKTLGKKFKSEFLAVKNIFPEIIEQRATKLAKEFSVDPSKAMQFLESLSENDFRYGMSSYEGRNFRNWLEQKNLVQPRKAVPAKPKEMKLVPNEKVTIEMLDEILDRPQEGLNLTPQKHQGSQSKYGIPEDMDFSWVEDLPF